MDFTALHQALGLEPGPLTDQMLDEAVRSGVEEVDALDWKRALPAEKDLAQSDFAKDIAAMANSGGGLIVYGVEEANRAATRRVDVGEITESQERTMRRVAVSGIQPPVFGLGLHRLGIEPDRALVVVVPASVDAPHLVYRQDYFGAPVRNHADTEWMRERQLEAMYRVRFSDRQSADQAQADLFTEISAGRAAERAWMFGVARPRVTQPMHRRVTRDEARGMFAHAYRVAPTYATAQGRHPLQDVDRDNPRPGLRRWVAPNTADLDATRWKAAWATVHEGGSVTLAAAVGAAPNREGTDPSWLVQSDRAERFVGDLFALVRASSDHFNLGEFELQIGVEWPGNSPLVIQTSDQFGFPFPDASIPLTAYAPVKASIRADVDARAFKDQLADLALDVVNQGGIQHLRAISAQD